MIYKSLQIAPISHSHCKNEKWFGKSSQKRGWKNVEKKENGKQNDNPQKKKRIKIARKKIKYNFKLLEKRIINRT